MSEICERVRNYLEKRLEGNYLVEEVEELNNGDIAITVLYDWIDYCPNCWFNDEYIKDDSCDSCRNGRYYGDEINNLDCGASTRITGDNVGDLDGFIDEINEQNEEYFH